MWALSEPCALLASVQALRSGGVRGDQGLYFISLRLCVCVWKHYPIPFISKAYFPWLCFFWLSSCIREMKTAKHERDYEIHQRTCLGIFSLGGKIAFFSICGNAEMNETPTRNFCLCLSVNSSYHLDILQCEYLLRFVFIVQTLFTKYV